MFAFYGSIGSCGCCLVCMKCLGSSGDVPTEPCWSTISDPLQRYMAVKRLAMLGAVLQHVKQGLFAACETWAVCSMCNECWLGVKCLNLKGRCMSWSYVGGNVSCLSHLKCQRKRCHWGCKFGVKLLTALSSKHCLCVCEYACGQLQASLVVTPSVNT